MIQFIKGDLFESDATILINTVNCVGVMGKGIALEFKKRFPKNYIEYVKRCNDSSNKLSPGTLFIFAENEKLIINFPTKDHWRFPSKYEYIESGLKTLVNFLNLETTRKVAIPALGCSNGGLSWEKVKPMIENALKDCVCEILVYEPLEN